MKTQGSFTFWLDGVQLKDFDTFEKKIKNLNIKEIFVAKLEIHGKTV